MSESFDASEFLSGYLAEAEEHLAAATGNLLAAEAALRKHEPSPKQVRELLRSLHTLKGLSAMVGVEPVVDLAHAMEAVLRAADRAGGVLPAAGIETLLDGLRAMGERVRALASKQPVQPAPSPLLDALAALESGELQALRPEALDLEPALSSQLTTSEKAQLSQAIASGRRALRLEFVPSPERAEAGITITTVRERVGALAEIVRIVPLSLPASEHAPGGIAFALLLVTDAPDDRVAAAASTTPDALREITFAGGAPAPEIPEGEPADFELQRRGVVRVEVARLDDALERLSDLVVARFRLERAVAEQRAHGVDVRDLGDIVRELGRKLRDLRGAIMRARMVPVAELLERVPLIVRGLSRATGKQVRVEIDAGRAELDKAVAERIFPAVVHLVRNAVDHALEPPEERRRLGKPEEGLVRVTCFERSNNQLELAITDDGRGIDREAVARRAGRPVPATDDGLLELLTVAGLSTLDQATTTSGRGLGMDIVRRAAVDQLGGELSLRTEPGAGTTFTLRIPLTITIVEAFSFACGDERFVAPVAGIEEVVELDPSRMLRGPSRRAGGEVQMIERRGEVVPVLRLDELFAIHGDGGRKALVVRRNGAPFAFAVDRMLGQQEVVVRPLEDPLVRVAGVSGSTDLGDGRPTLVLDLVGLSGKFARSEVEAPS